MEGKVIFIGLRPYILQCTLIPLCINCKKIWLVYYVTLLYYYINKDSSKLDKPYTHLKKKVDLFSLLIITIIYLQSERRYKKKREDRRK